MNVCGGIVGNYIIGPHFVDGGVNGQVDFEFLQNTLLLCLEDVPLNIPQRMWFLHGGDPAHNTALIQY